MEKLYLFISIIILIFVGSVWKTDDLLNLLIKLCIISAGIFGVAILGGVIK